MSSLSHCGGLSLSDLWQLLPDSEPRLHQLQHHALARTVPELVCVKCCLSIWLFGCLVACLCALSNDEQVMARPPWCDEKPPEVTNPTRGRMVSTSVQRAAAEGHQWQMHTSNDLKPFHTWSWICSFMGNHCCIPQLPKPWLALPVDAAVGTASGSGAPAPLHEV